MKTGPHSTLLRFRSKAKQPQPKPQPQPQPVKQNRNKKKNKNYRNWSTFVLVPALNGVGGTGLKVMKMDSGSKMTLGQGSRLDSTGMDLNVSIIIIIK
jgi:hypothetical protein